MYLTFAWRYFKAKKSTNAINIISWVSVTAIIVGTASLIIILSVFNGFENLVKSLYSSFYTDLRIAPAKGKTLLLSSEQVEMIRGSKGIRNISLVAEEKALLQNGDFQAIVFVKGVDENYIHVSGVADKMIKGKFEIGNVDAPGAVMGVGIENAIGVLSDRSILPLTLYLPKKGVKDFSNPLESLSQGQLVPSGSFAIQQDFDNKYLITNLEFMKLYVGLADNEYSAVEIALDDASEENAIQKNLQQKLGDRYIVQTRYEQNKTLYSTIQLEKWAIYGIFSLILLVAAFNMIGALTMLVLEKKKDIQVLQAMGADRSVIRRIFLTEGIVLALIGAGAGIVIALLLYFIQVTYKIVPIEGSSFLINYYPVKLVPSDFVLVLATVFIIGLLASWVPALRASRQPFELRA
jgi:lipoprotein-releasing system permease protein